MRWWWHGWHTEDAWIPSQNAVWCKQRDDDINRCEADVSPVVTQSLARYLSSVNLRNGWNQHLGFCSRWLNEVKTLRITNVLLESVTSGNLLYWFLIGIFLALIAAWVLQTSIQSSCQEIQVFYQAREGQVKMNDGLMNYVMYLAHIFCVRNRVWQW